MTADPINDKAVRARVVELHASGMGRNQIARELGLSSATVSRIAVAESLTFDRSRTAVATEARQADLKARRLALVERAYQRAEALYTRLEAERFSTLVRGTEGREVIKSLDFVPTQNERDVAQAISVHLTAAAKLEAIDSDTRADDAKSMLTELGRALGIGSTESTGDNA